jgi:hypothetical protein
MSDLLAELNVLKANMTTSSNDADKISDDLSETYLCVFHWDNVRNECVCCGRDVMEDTA